MIAFILVNTAILMLQDYYPHEAGAAPWGNKLLDSTELVFIVFFTFECMVKVIAQGFVLHRPRGALHRGSRIWPHGCRGDSDIGGCVAMVCGAYTTWE